MLLDGVYCLITHINEYPQYNFENIKRLAEMGQEIESQTKEKLSSVEAALHTTTSPDINVNPPDNYKGFGDK